MAVHVQTASPGRSGSDRGPDKAQPGPRGSERADRGGAAGETAHRSDPPRHILHAQAADIFVRDLDESGVGPSIGLTPEPAWTLEPGAELRFGVVVHNRDLADVIRPRYAESSLRAVRSVLERLGTLEIATLDNGLPQAAEERRGAETRAQGYHHVWTRDAVFIANAWLQTGAHDKARAALKALIAYYATGPQIGRMLDTIESKARHRPHVKFDGARLRDMEGGWNHAQNDALGLFLWLAFRAARSGAIDLSDADLEPLAVLAAYLGKIDFTKDKEVGHWEEGGGKISASTLRCVLAGLQEMRRWADEDTALGGCSRRTRLQRALARKVRAQSTAHFDFESRPGSLSRLIDRGAVALQLLLPNESVGEGIYARTTDLAQLSAIYLDLIADPADRLIDPETTRFVLYNIERLLGDSHGHRRYLGDGYWAAYEKEGASNVDFRRRMIECSLEERIERGPVEGGEAQWTIGAPMLSVIYGLLYSETHEEKYLVRQTFELNRALGMVTGAKSSLGPGAIPESYMLIKTGVKDARGRPEFMFAENPIPLNWAKANLRLAVDAMARSLALSRRIQGEEVRPMKPLDVRLASNL